MKDRQPAHVLCELDQRVTERVRIRRWQHRGGTEVPRWPSAAHETIEVAWAEQGELVYRVGSVTLRARPGEAMVVPADTEHLTTIAPGTVATSVQLGAPLVAEMRELVAGTRRLEFRVLPGDGGIMALGHLMLEEARTAREGAFASTDALAEALSVRLLRGFGAGDPGLPSRGSDPRIARAVDAVEDRFAEPLSIDELARAAGMSRYHFSRIFRAQIGQSPHQFLVATRVRRAAELLRRGRHSVTEAAFSVGFGDLGRFARAFRKQMGCAPSAFC
jgi:AraC family transcriptional regulator